MLETEAHHDALDFSADACNIEARRSFVQKFSIAVRRRKLVPMILWTERT